MTDDKKHDDKDRKKLSDEEMEDVAGGFTVPARPSGKGKKKPGGPDGDGKLSKKERKR